MREMVGRLVTGRNCRKWIRVSLMRKKRRWQDLYRTCTGTVWIGKLSCVIWHWEWLLRRKWHKSCRSTRALSIWIWAKIDLETRGWLNWCKRSSSVRLWFIWTSVEMASRSMGLNTCSIGWGWILRWFHWSSGATASGTGIEWVKSHSARWWTSSRTTELFSFLTSEGWCYAIMG